MGKTALMYSCMETGRDAGMRTMDQDVARLWVLGRINEATALASCRNVTVMKDHATWLRNQQWNNNWKS
jgi:Tfp pilus assembly pilus retraction ATPase PilT